MEEQAPLIFDIIKNFHEERLKNHLRHSDGPSINRDLLQQNEDGIRAIEFTFRLLIETRETRLRERLVQIIKALLNAVKIHDVGYQALTCSGGETLLHLAVVSQSAELIRALLELDCDPEARNKNHLSPIDLAFQITDWQQGLSLVAALVRLNGRQTERLLQLPDAATEETAETGAQAVAGDLLPSTIIHTVIYLALKERKQAASALLGHVDLSVLSELTLTDEARAILIHLAVSTGNPAVIDALGTGVPIFSEYEHPLLNALDNDSEDVAIALVRMGFTTGRVLRLGEPMFTQQTPTSPLLVALSKGMDSFLEVCFSEGYVLGDHFMTDVGLSDDLHQWLKERPHLIGFLSLNWTAVNSLLRHAQISRSLVVTLWPALTKGFSIVEPHSLFHSRMIGETERCQNVTPFLVNSSVCPRMSPLFFQTIINSFLKKHYISCEPAFVQGLHANGARPTYACVLSVWMINKINENEPLEDRRKVRSKAIAFATAACSGTIHFLKKVESLAPCPYMQHLCLSALVNPDNLLQLAGKALECKNLPADYRVLLQEVHDRLLLLWGQVGDVLIPSLQELSTIELCGSLGLNGCNPAAIVQLAGRDTPLSKLTDQALTLITLIAMEYKRQGAWPNPLAAFAFVALLEMQDEDWSWLAEAYYGSAEIEDNPDD